MFTINKTAENIAKAFGVEIEKAHKHGDLHPNGKWYWNSSANGGKGDWRVIKRTETKQTSTAANTVTTGEKPKSQTNEKTGERFLKNPKGEPVDLTKEKDGNLYFTRSLLSVSIRDYESELPKYEGKNDKESKRKADNLNDMLRKLRGSLSEVDDELIRRAKEAGNYVHRLNDNDLVVVSRGKNGKWNLNVSGRIIETDDPSFAKEKLLPRVKRALQKEIDEAFQRK